ncbi:MAG: glucose-1-phosphate thymidylyltransferase, partial [Clostridium sp.]|nr:glucose-1-phosphate thymidylyltransferase [Clostridium sp.]
SFTSHLKRASKMEKGATIFGYYVQDPRSFGVVDFDENGKVTSLEEKPEEPKSKYAVPGLYFYDNSVVEKAKKIKPSERGELEITDLNKAYMEEGTLQVELLGRGMAWLDTGTHTSMLQASNFVEAVQTTQGTYIACLEEISYRQGWISAEQVLELAKPLMKTGYGKYLVDIVEEVEGRRGV